MTNLDQLKRTFFDECSELLQQTEAGLTDIREGHNVDEAINAVFRAVHSVKGGAGVFGFEPLVEFAHVFETVLDAVRHGKLTATPEVIDVLLMASDVLTDLVQMSRTGEAIAPDFGNDCRAALQQLMERDAGTGANNPDDNVPAPAEFEGLDFTPVRAENFDDGTANEAVLRSFRISVAPRPDMLRQGGDPLPLLRQLRQLGELELTAETDALPSFDELQPDQPYIGWKGTLRTQASRAQIEEVLAGNGRYRRRFIGTGADPGDGARGGKRGRYRKSRGNRGAFDFRQAFRNHHAHRARKDRPRGEHGGRTGDCASDAGSDCAGSSRAHQQPVFADPGRGRSPHPGTERQRHVNAGTAGQRGIPAYAAVGA
jgi:HPt (histidine-containing phosphotransfer) domain-containing protein